MTSSEFNSVSIAVKIYNVDGETYVAAKRNSTVNDIKATDHVIGVKGTRNETGTESYYSMSILQILSNNKSVNYIMENNTSHYSNLYKGLHKHDLP